VIHFYKKMQAFGTDSALSIARTKPEMRRSNTGSIYSFSEMGKMVVRPVGQRIINPAASTFGAKSINPSTFTKTVAVSNAPNANSNIRTQTHAVNTVIESIFKAVAVNNSNNNNGTRVSNNNHINNYDSATIAKIVTSTDSSALMQNTPRSPSSLTYHLPSANPSQHATSTASNLTLYKNGSRPNGYTKPNGHTHAHQHSQNNSSSDNIQNKQHPTKPNEHSHTILNGFHPPPSSSDPTWVPVQKQTRAYVPGRKSFDEEGGSEHSYSNDNDSILDFLKKIKT
jgi:hypothetical protein